MLGCPSSAGSGPLEMLRARSACVCSSPGQGPVPAPFGGSAVELARKGWLVPSPVDRPPGPSKVTGAERP